MKSIKKQNFSEKSKKLNDFLALRRKELGITQLEVSEFLGFQTPQYISNFERNIHSPSLEAIRKLIEFYKIPKDQVIDIMVDAEKRYLYEVL